MKEIACQFGEAGRLHGIVTLPDLEQRRRPGLALVLLSAGLMAKTGPYRLYTQVARSLADLGYTTLRFDLGGIGSSQIARPDQPLRVRTEMDVREALDYLGNNYQIDEFVIGGLCSGAEDAFRYAEIDERARGVILVDPHAYESITWKLRGFLTRYTLNRIAYRLLRTMKAIELVKDARTKSNVEGFEGNLINYQYMKKAESTRILSTLIGRGTNVHYIYTGGRIDIFHHKKQFYSMFRDIDLKGRLLLDHLPHIEHIQIFGEDREVLVDVITRRFASTY